MAKSDLFAHPLAEHVAAAAASAHAAAPFTHVMAGGSSLARDALPRLGAALDVAPISEVTGVEADGATFTRPIYAGAAFARVRSHDAVRVVTVRATAFDKAADGGAAAPVADAPAAELPAEAAWVKDELAQSDRPELTTAAVVVSGGRALKSREVRGVVA